MKVLQDKMATSLKVPVSLNDPVVLRRFLINLVESLEATNERITRISTDSNFLESLEQDKESLDKLKSILKLDS